MQALVVEEGQVIWANDELAWAKYQMMVLRELEDYYWKQSHAGFSNHHQAGGTAPGCHSETATAVEESQAKAPSQPIPSFHYEAEIVVDESQARPATKPTPQCNSKAAIAAEESQATAQNQPKVTTHINRNPLHSTNDAFTSLMRMWVVNAKVYSQWTSTIGIHNRIVHEYMNLNMELILNLVRTERYCFIVNFLEKKMDTQGGQS